MVCVYVLQSQTNGRFYVGSTDNLERRFSEHNNGKSKATKPGIPWNLVFKLSCRDLSEARAIEYRLKRKKSRKIIEQIVEDGEIRFLRG